MGCEVVNFPGGGGAIICGRRRSRPKRCHYCNRPSGWLCDFTTPSIITGAKGAGKTCDLPICAFHRVSQGVEVDWCAQHVEEQRRAEEAHQDALAEEGYEEALANPPPPSSWIWDFRRKRVPRRKMFEVGGTVYTSGVTMERECRRIMDEASWSGGYWKGPDLEHDFVPAPNERTFTSRTLTDLISRYHYFCPLLGLSPDRFRKAPHPPQYKDYYLMGHFDAIPINGGWHGVAWTKCVKHPTFDDEVKEGFRRMIMPYMNLARKKACELCGRVDNLQVDHFNPTFAEIIAQVLSLFTPRERETWCGFNWIEYEEFQPPTDHPAMKLFLQLHANSTLTTLCSSCHNELTQGRKL